MEITAKARKVETFAEGGVVHAEVTIRLPHAEGEERGAAAVNAFYDRMAAGALEIGRTLLFPRAKARYEASSDPRRRFTHRPYRLELTAVCSPLAEGIKVKREVILSHRGRRLYYEAIWERITPEGRVLASREKKRGKPKTSRRKKEKEQ